MLIDLHTHSDYSDGRSTYEQIVAAARARGVDGVAVTDHDVQGDPERLQRAAEREGVACFLGMEMSCAEGHFLVFGLGGAHDKRSALGALAMDPANERPAAADVAAAVNRLGGAVVAAHPFLSCYRNDGSNVNNTTVPGIVAAEVHNGSVEGMIEEQCWSRLHATRLGLGRTGGSDAHGAGHVGCCATIFSDPVGDVGELIAGLRSGSTEGAMLDDGCRPVRWGMRDEVTSWRAGSGGLERVECPPPPVPLAGAAGVVDEKRSRAVFIGGVGIDFEPHGSVVALELDAHEWSVIDTTGDVPAPRSFAGACLLEGGEALVVGGWSPEGEGGCLSDAFVLDLETCEWRRGVSAGLPPARGARLARVGGGAVAAVGRYSRFGGSKATDLVHTLARGASEWRGVEGPRIRWGLGAAAWGGGVHAWGGFNYFRTSTSHDRLDVESGEWTSRELPDALVRRDFACCEIAPGRVLVAGGQMRGRWPVPEADAVIFDFGGNEPAGEIAPAGAGPAIHASAVYDAARGRAYIAGGLTVEPT